MITPTLIAICGAVFVSMVLSRVSPIHPTPHQLVHWGANFAPLTVSGQWWRPLTSMFLHIGVIHLAVNMWCLWDLGGLAERIFGRGIFLAIYLLAGLTGAVLGIAWHPFTVVAGASGAIFGIAGALLACFYFGELGFPRHAVKALLLSLVAFTTYNLLLGILNPPADNAAHFGGLLSGFLLGLLLLRFPVRYVLTSAALCLLLSCLILHRTSVYTVYAERGRAAMASGNIDVAIAALSQSLRMKPGFAEGYSWLGQAYLQRRQYPQAERLTVMLLCSRRRPPTFNTSSEWPF